MNLVAAARSAQIASRRLRTLSTSEKNRVLEDIAGALRAGSSEILNANAEDVRAATASGLAPAKLKRLELTAKSIEQLAAGVLQVAALPDPVGAETDAGTRPSGLRVRRVRVPLGVVCMIYEARPGVTVDAFALCFKAGNACILKGGREAARSNAALASIVHEVLERRGIPREALTSVDAASREELRELLQLDRFIDLVLPRGGEELIRFVSENSRIPTIQHYKGVCHIFVDESADQSRAIEVCVAAKTSAPATCNAAECVLVHRKIAGEFLPKLARAFVDAGVEVRADAGAFALMPGAVAAAPDDFGKEFLDTIVAVAVVESVQGAIDHIARFGSHHTEAILTSSAESARAFREGVDASCVVVNASTRFNDGFQLGLGAEIGISTSKLHAYGPMGLEELTTRRFEIDGDFQTR
ncbi:MAG: glutamate-5-semialdehyde dehydrogenase [Phycisphaeraceae bacterium]|nr:glutamate-5-semialdehyde dehydrogenase [Phycisphaeraceae bacterium]